MEKHHYKTIDTLIPDVYELLRTYNGTLDVQARVGSDDRAPTLRLSQMGPRCPKALWYSIHHPELAEPLPPQAIFKYSYGHAIENLAIQLAKLAGHTVTGEQDELVVDGIKGHRDCVIDGCVVDVKSTTSIGFQKFKDKSLVEKDDFGYLDQLDGYLVGSLSDPAVTVKDRGYLWAIDKNLGHMCLYEHCIREQSIRSRIKAYREIVENVSPPACLCGTVPDGKSGNIKLDTRASYSAFKLCCWPNLRTFLYANGPVYLTHVARTPDVPEVRRSQHDFTQSNIHT